jgi:Leucine-rich repeat (LRR) protein
MVAGECFSEHQEHLFQIKIPFPMSELALKLIRENIEKHNRGEDASVLDLGNCGMTEVPEELRECVWLETLVFGINILNRETREKWNASINSAKSNKINNFPFFLAEFTNLKQLFVSGQSLSNFDIIGHLDNLQSLDCSWNPITDLSPVSNLINLQNLDCLHTQITDITPVSNLINLQSLNCSGNRITDITPVSNLINLQSLNCSGNRITGCVQIFVSGLYF